MKNRNLLLLLLPLFLLTACNPTTTEVPKDEEQQEEHHEDEEHQEEHHEDEEHQEEEHHEDEEDEEDGDGIDPMYKLKRETLECGSLQSFIPKNYRNPLTLTTTLQPDESSWSNNSFTSSFPSDFRYIWGNRCDDDPYETTVTPSFYSTTSGGVGGLRFDNEGIGFQTPMFTHEGAKLEVRLYISQYKTNQQKEKPNEDPIHIYFFNRYGKELGYKTIKQESFKPSAEYYKLYYSEDNAPNVAYMEIRYNTFGKYNGTCYNIGIKSFSFKSWERK